MNNETKDNSITSAPAVSSSVGLGGAKIYRLQQVLVQWREAERAHARAVLCAAHPHHIRKLSDEVEYALHHVRLNVDSEPWAEIATS